MTTPKHKSHLLYQQLFFRKKRAIKAHKSISGNQLAIVIMWSPEQKSYCTQYFLFLRKSDMAFL